MTFDEFQKINVERCEKAFHHEVNIINTDWPWHNWAICIAGETGEFCDLTKKILRGDYTLEEKRVELLKELADIITYADLAITSLGGNTGDVLKDKFNEVSKRVHFDKTL